MTGIPPSEEYKFWLRVLGRLKFSARHSAYASALFANEAHYWRKSRPPDPIRLIDVEKFIDIV